MRGLIFIITISICCCFSSSYAQGNSGKFALEIMKPKMGLNAGPYRGRTQQTDGLFNQGVAGFTQVYFPFQWVIDYRNNFSDSATIKNEYNKRLFLIRPLALFHFVDNGSYAMGIGIQFSFLITHQFYLEYQTATIYMEAPKTAAPDLRSGFNLHHFISVSKPISKRLSLSLGYTHISNAFLVSTKGSNQDIITIGGKCNF